MLTERKMESNSGIHTALLITQILTRAGSQTRFHFATWLFVDLCPIVTAKQRLNNANNLRLFPDIINFVREEYKWLQVLYLAVNTRNFFIVYLWTMEHGKANEELIFQKELSSAQWWVMLTRFRNWLISMIKVKHMLNLIDL